ncbi:stage V sporulation protein B [Effusibacillus lacus]|uniref:Stage V sporulation protein B n=1 Tax=Effusibacillus lacus TaxID=1348429 RepID=A0A292YSR1_9BACL|nr:stage V sporulation protein B [Effusibacillus lacus]TCS68969.1 stage V sporulation protein B [Effusibacillus lacus]GAX91464.1 stage V sporulation protein B [Effusibacillus lacus]
MSKQSFLHGAMVLVLASIVTKIIGMGMQIVLNRIVGPEGIGLFRMVFPMLMMILTLSTIGLPTAVSKVIAEAIAVGDRRKVKRVMVFTTVVVTVLSTAFTIGVLGTAAWLTNHLLTDSRTYYTVLAMTPTILVISWSSILRGYFQGIQNQTPPSVAWILETIVRATLTLLIVYYCMPDLVKASAGAMLGLLAGELTHLAYIAACYWRKYGLQRIPIPPMAPYVKPEPFRKTIWSLFEVAGPVTVAGIIGSFAYWLETLLIPRALLASGLTKEEATAAFGLYSGYAVSLLVLPTVFTYALSTTILPSISEAVALNQPKLVQRRLYQAFRFTAIMGLPSSVIFTLLATELSTAIYNTPAAGPILAVMAPVGFFIYLKTPLSSILQGMNRAGLAMFYSIVGSAIKLAVIYWLASKPGLGIMGVAWAVVISNVIVCCAYFLAVTGLIGFYVDLADTLKILVSTLVMSLIIMQAKAVTAGMGSSYTVIFGVSIGLLVYLMLLFLLRVLSLHTVNRIPYVGPVMAKALQWIPFVK